MMRLLSNMIILSLCAAPLTGCVIVQQPAYAYSPPPPPSSSASYPQAARGPVVEVR